MKINKGRFSIDNPFRFRPGTTYKEPQKFWNNKWLYKELQEKSVRQIAKENSVSRAAIQKWINKYHLNNKGLVIYYYINDNNKISIETWCHGELIETGKFSECIHKI